jgi:hypothetical protein
MDKRVCKLQMWISLSEKERLEKMAARANVTVADFIRQAVNEKTACINGTDILTTRQKLAA